jgi:hypothetical protein
MGNIGADILKETEAWALGQIRAAQESMAVMLEVRELSAVDWEIEELCRSIVFYELQHIEWMKGEAERARAARREPQRI